ncbi:MAG TPA: glycosyltransferase family 39 protein [Solirubrobacteraceae bacterium]|nr:glycosyltransferase family 39 protein [Solirubrobacteraceae bacterium]
MATVTAPPGGIPRSVDFKTPKRLERVPVWASTTVFVLVLMAISAYIRTRYISAPIGQFWEDEAITTGIASHSLGAIPGILRHDGSPPLFYLLLHFWIGWFGASEAAAHSLSLVFGLLTIPAGLWAGWSLFGRRAGMYMAVLCAFSTFLTAYAQEARMYELMGLLGIIQTAAFIHGFVYRRRRYVILFSVCEALMLYTHAWGIFFAAGSVVALIPIWLTSDDRRGIVRDAVLAYVGAAVLFLPWVPNFIYQATHTGAPWAPTIRFGVPVLLSRDLLGADRITVALLVAWIVGLAPLFTKRYRRTRDGTVMWSLIWLISGTLIIAWLASQITPAFVARYMAPILASILLLAAWGAARSGVLGLVCIALSVLFVVHPSSYAPVYKSDMQDISGEVTPLLHRGDLVVSAQPDSMPLAWYYLPAGLRWASTIGPVKDPSYMDWVYAQKRLEHAAPAATLDPLVASLRPGQQLLYVRPLTEGQNNWKAPWTSLVRRRAAQWGQILQDDVNSGVLKEVTYAPHNYRGASILAYSAVLYQKVS